MHNYAGNPDNFPVTNQEPDDADIASPNAAVFNVMYEGLSDRTAALANGYVAAVADIATLKAVDTTSLPNGAMRAVVGYGRYRLDKTGAGASDTEDQPLVIQPTTGTGRWFALDDKAAHQYFKSFLTVGSNSWTCPRNLAKVIFELVGGGAGGGGGTGAGTTGNATGGGGGGGGTRFLGHSNTIPANVYTLTVGGGGAGGVAPAGIGGAGSSSVAFGFEAPGGQPSQGTAPVTTAVMVPGGVRGQAAVALRSPFQVTGLTNWPVGPGDGGFSQTPGSSIGSSAPGGTSPEGNLGGAAGANGSTSTGLGGVGGGGGGGGPGGPGGDGGHGGNGSATVGAAGLAGADAGPFTGGGGGGGGGGGTGGTSGGNGGNGGQGGSGFIILRGFALVTSYV
jgi:hypothetical protein